MLNFIRERAQGWIAWFIVGLISIPFALWGINSYLSGPAKVVVAEVNGTEITQNQLQQSLSQYRDRMRSMLGEQFDPDMFESATLKREVLDGLIQQQLIQDLGRSLKQRINDVTVSEMIRSTPAFQRDGEFDSEYYAMMLARIGYSPAQFEAQYRSDLLSQQLVQNIQSSTFVSKTELSQIFKLEKQQRQIAYGVMPIDGFVESVNITDEEITNYYQQNKDIYTAPETIKVDYIQLSIDDIAAGLMISDEELRNYYTNHMDEFAEPAQRRVSHILIEGDDDSALSTINDIKMRLDAGEDFAELAKTFSQDTGSAMQGGDLGFFSRGVMTSEFEDAAFDLSEVDAISEPIKTEFGYHLIKLTGIKEQESKSFESVRANVEQRVKRQQAEAQLYDEAEQLANISFENPDSLEIAAEDLGLEIKTSQRFTRSGTDTGIFSNKKVVAAAFSEDVLDNDLNSEVIELSETDMIVIHKNTHVPESTLPLESVTEVIKQKLTYEQARNKVREAGESILLKIKSGTSPEIAFENWQAAAFYDRVSDSVSPQILQKAFELPKPASSPEYVGFLAENGNYIVVELSAVKDGELSEDAQENEALEKQLTQVYGNAELEAFIQSLRDNAKIEINEAALASKQN